MKFSGGVLAVVCLCSFSQEVDQDLQKKIDTAIDQGVVWLKKQQQSDGGWPGMESTPERLYDPKAKLYQMRPEITAFALVALLKSRVKPDDQAITKGFAFVDNYLKNMPKAKGLDRIISNYGRAVILMAYEAKYSAEYEKREKKPKPLEERRFSANSNDKRHIDQLVRDLIDQQSSEGGWRYEKDAKKWVQTGDPQDVSHTQFVLLGLKSAFHFGVNVPESVYKKAMNYILSAQEKDGPVMEPPENQGKGRDTFVIRDKDKARGFSYITKKPDKPQNEEKEKRATGSMTTAGLGSLLICKWALKGRLQKKEIEKLDIAIFDGLAWIFKNYKVGRNPNGYRSHYYYLYGIERVGMLGKYEKFGNIEWYKDGAKLLCDEQDKNGSWDSKSEAGGDKFKAVADTCFALLFLTRGSTSVGDIMTQ